MVERQPSKLGVAGSSPVARSITPRAGGRKRGSMTRLPLYKVVFAALAVFFAILPFAVNGRADDSVISAQAGTTKGRAIQALNAGDFDGAIKILEGAGFQDPFDDDYKTLLAQAYDGRGWKRLNAGDFKEALEDFGKARLDEPEKEFSTYFGLAYCSYRLEQMDDAQGYLDEALYLKPSSAQARTLKGEVYYKQGRLRDAVSEWEQALQDKPQDKVIQGLLAKASKELGVEGSFTKRETYNFNLKYDGEEDRKLGEFVLDILQDVASDVGSDLDFYQKEPVNVILYTKRQFVDITHAPAWSDGIFDGNIRIPAGGGMIDRTALSAVLHHEYTHAVIHTEISGHVPAWLDEGVAQYEEHWASRRKSGDFTPVPLSSLDSTFAKLDATKAREAYAESLSAVRYYVNTYGIYSLSQLLKDMGKGKDVSGAMKYAAGVSLPEFEREWREDLGR